jgi:uncharacterized protein YwbE
MMASPITDSTDLRPGMTVTWTDRDTGRVNTGTISAVVTHRSESPPHKAIVGISYPTAGSDWFFQETLCVLHARVVLRSCPKRRTAP